MEAAAAAAQDKETPQTSKISATRRGHRMVEFVLLFAYRCNGGVVVGKPTRNAGVVTHFQDWDTCNEITLSNVPVRREKLPE